MDKLSTPKAASSPVPSDSVGGETKHDSFLEDVGLLPGVGGSGNYWLSERNVTKRNKSPTTGSPFSSILSKDDLDENNCEESIEKKRNIDKSSINPITTSRKEIGSGDRSYRDDKQRIDNYTRKSRYSDSKTFDNKTRQCNNDKIKLNVDKKISVRRSTGSNDKEKITEVFDDRKDTSVKTKQSVSVSTDVCRDRQRRSDNGDKNLKDISDSVGLLSAIKDIVSNYTKEESIKITKTMNELHILSQASILKNFILQTDEIKKINGNKGEYREIIEENKILRENYQILKLRYDNAMKELDERDKVYEENKELRLRIQELLAKNSS